MTNIAGRSIRDVVLSDPATGVGYKGASAADVAAQGQLSKSYYDSATALAPGTDQAAGIGVGIVATVAGNVVLKFAGGGTWTVPVAVGLTILPLAVIGIVAAGTTATASYVKLT